MAEIIDNTRFIQIVPINGKIFAVYSEDDGTEYKVRIFFTALQADGEIIFLDFDDHGIFDGAADASNFLRFEREL